MPIFTPLAARLRRAATLAAVLAVSLATSGCSSLQTLRLFEPPRSAAQAAAETVRIEPPASEGEPAGAGLYAGPKNPQWWKSGPRDTPALAHEDIWERIRAGMQLQHTGDARFRRSVSWFSARERHIDRSAERGRPFLPYIVEQIEQRGMPTELALLPMIESAFRPRAYSSMRAAGLWQFMPATGRVFGLKQNWWYDGRRDIVHSTRAALDYLQKLVTEFDGDWLLALASYNAGEGNVRRAIKRNRRSGKPTDFWHLELPRETEAYVPRLLALSAVIANPGHYDITLPHIPNEQYFEVVELDSQIELALAAELADLSLDELMHLNPGFHRWATDPAGPHDLVLRAGHGAAFRQRLAAIPEAQRVRWARHTVRPGESLGLIATRYGTSVRELQRLNKTRGTLIRVGRTLLVPAGNAGVTQAATPSASPTSTTASYRVRNGDNLWLIARRHDTHVRTLTRLNSLSKGTVLQPGQQLLVPVPQGSTMAKAASSDAGQGLRRIRYTVRQGDSLWQIARHFGVNVTSLRRWNSLRGNSLRPGQKLDVYLSRASAT